MVGHRVPVVPAQRPRHHQRRFSGNINACLRVHLRPAIRAHAGRPVERDVWLGRNELARRAVEHVEIAVLGRLHQHLPTAPVDFHFGQHDVLRGGVIPGFARRGLVVPDIFAGIGADRDDARQIEIVAFAAPVGAGAAIGAVPRGSVADTEIEQVELGIVGHRVPHRAAAADAVLARQRVAAPGLGCGLQIVGRVIALVAGHGIEAPQLLTIRRVIGGDIAAHAELGAAIADQHLAIDHTWRAGDGVALVLVDGNFLPRHRAAIAVERDQPPVERAEEELVAPCRQPAIDHVAAGLDPGFAGYLRIVAPQRFARRGVIGEDLAPGGGDIELAIHHQRRGFLPARGVHVGEPGEPQIAHAVSVDLVERGEALFGIGSAMRDPVGRVRACIDQPHRVDAARGHFVCPRTATAQHRRHAQRGRSRPNHPSHLSLPGDICVAQ